MDFQQRLEKAAQRIPNLAGIKFSCGDIMELQACLAVGDGKFDVLFGQDENLLAALSLGVRGAIGSTYNYAAPLYHRVIAAFEAGDLETARQEQLKSVRIVQRLLPYGILRAGKAIMQLLDVPCGPVRQPIPPMTSFEAGELYREIRDLELFADVLESTRQR